jgi:uncharacterized protein YutE (UPF0331/DUF86 family)
MKEYLPKLYKKINEIGFKFHSDIFKKAVTEKTTKSEWVELELISSKTNGPIFESEFSRCIKDVLMIKGYPNDSFFKSDIIQDVLSLLDHASELFKRHVFPDEVYEIMDIMSQYNTKMVGGSVRDILLNKSPKDFDFVTDASYNEVTEELTKHGYTIKETGKHFLVMIASKNGWDFEISNFRKDGTYSDGRHPEAVMIGDIYDDAFRRDFTVNALYLDVKTFNLQDPTGQGLDDFQERTLKFVGKPKERIKEDYLRCFRFYRFLDKGFEPDPVSLSAVREIFSEAIAKTSPERIRVEIERMVKL